jgi:hypothetical protein
MNTPPAVTSTEPPGKSYVDTLLRVLLRTPLHRVLSDKLLLLTFTGRRTGRRFTIPVGHHEVDGQMWLLTGSRWRHNVRGGAPVTVVLRGRRRRARATLVEDPEEVARLHLAALQRLGFARAERVGLEVREARMPTLAEMREATRTKAAVRVELED